MYYMEAQNHDTGSTAPIYDENRESMHKTLTDKGFRCLVKYGCYAGLNNKGEEVSCTSHFGVPAAQLNPVNQDEQEVTP